MAEPGTIKVEDPLLKLKMLLVKQLNLQMRASQNDTDAEFKILSGSPGVSARFQEVMMETLSWLLRVKVMLLYN